MKALGNLVARLLLAHIFLLAGLNKIFNYQATANHMAEMNVPAQLLPFVIALEVVGGVALVIGFQTRLAALSLALFSLLTAVLFHANIGDQTQMALFMKNWAIAGGLLMFAIYGGDKISVDNQLNRKKDSWLST